MEIVQVDFRVTSVNLMITRAPNQISSFVSIRASATAVSAIASVSGLAATAAVH